MVIFYFMPQIGLCIFRDFVVAVCLFRIFFSFHLNGIFTARLDREPRFGVNICAESLTNVANNFEVPPRPSEKTFGERKETFN